MFPEESRSRIAVGTRSAAVASVATDVFEQSTRLHSTNCWTLPRDRSGNDRNGDAIKSKLRNGNDRNGKLRNGSDANTKLRNGNDRNGDASKLSERSGNDRKGDAVKSKLRNGKLRNGKLRNGIPAIVKDTNETPSLLAGFCGSMPKSVEHDRPFWAITAHHRLRLTSPGNVATTVFGKVSERSGVAPRAMAAIDNERSGVEEKSRAPMGTSFKSLAVRVLRFVFSAGLKTSSREMDCNGLPAREVPPNIEGQPPGTSIGT